MGSRHPSASSPSPCRSLHGSLPLLKTQAPCMSSWLGMTPTTTPILTGPDIYPWMSLWIARLMISMLIAFYSQTVMSDPFVPKTQGTGCSFPLLHILLSSHHPRFVLEGYVSSIERSTISRASQDGSLFPDVA